MAVDEYNRIIREIEKEAERIADKLFYGYMSPEKAQEKFRGLMGVAELARTEQEGRVVAETTKG